MTQIIGSISGGLLLLAFFLVSRGKIDGQSRTYLIMQFFGALGVAFAALTKDDWSSLGLNAIWTIYALIALIILFWRKRQISDKV
jgi:hypothetical protein